MNSEDASLELTDQYTVPSPQTLVRWEEARAWLAREMGMDRPCGVIRVRISFENGQIRRWYPRQVRGARPGDDGFTEQDAEAGMAALETAVQSSLGRNFFGEISFQAGWRDEHLVGWSLDIEQSR